MSTVQSRAVPVTRRTEVAWYAYLALLTIFLPVYAATRLRESPTAFDVVDVPMAAIALVGVFGFVSQVRVLGPVFWRLFIPALLAWDITYMVLAWRFDLALRVMEGYWGYLVGELVFLAPAYAALLLYGYRSRTVWAGLADIRLPTLTGIDSNAQRWWLIVHWALLTPLPLLLSLELGFFQTLILACVVGAVVLAPLSILVLYLISRLRPQDFAVRCHVCDLTVMIAPRWPRNMSQFLRGGWTCRRCGSELDRHGNLRA